jgi:hypothetical protein
MPIARFTTIAVLALLIASPAHAQSESFRFGAIGDTSYSKRGEQEFDRMLDAMNKNNLAFIVHVGDFQADPRPYQRAPDRIPCLVPTKVMRGCSPRSSALQRLSF